MNQSRPGLSAGAVLVRMVGAEKNAGDFSTGARDCVGELGVDGLQGMKVQNAASNSGLIGQDYNTKTRGAEAPDGVQTAGDRDPLLGAAYVGARIFLVDDAVSVEQNPAVGVLPQWVGGGLNGFFGLHGDSWLRADRIFSRPARWTRN